MPTTLLAGALALLIAHAPDPGARAVLDTALARMGGLPAIRAVQRMQVEEMIEWQRQTLDTRPHAAVSSYELSSELRDYARPAWRYSRRFFTPNGPFDVVDVVTDSVAAVSMRGKWSAQNVAYVEERDEAFTFAAERIVLLARESAGARALPDTVIGGVRHARVVATVGRFRPTLYFRRGDGLLALARFRAAQPNDFGLAPWGEMDVDIWYSRWQRMGDAGLLLPTQLDVHRVGRPYKRISTIAAKVNPAIPADSFAISDSLRAAFLATSRRAMFDLPLDSARIVDGTFAVFGTPGTPAGAVKVGGRWLLIEAGTAPLSVERSVAFLRRADAATPVGGALVTASAGAGGIAWLVKQPAPTWIAGAARPYADAVLRGWNVRGQSPRDVAADRWITVGADSIRIEIIDLPDVPRTPIVYVPALRWVYAAPPGPVATEYVAAHVRRRGWIVDRIGSARGIPGAPLPAPKRGASAAAGTADSFALASAALRATMDVRVHLPAGYSSGNRYPVIYALQRGVFFERLQLPLWLDSAATAGLPAAILVAIPDAEGLDAFRPDTRAGDAFVRFIADELVPAVESRYATRAERGARLLLGFSAGANVLVDVAARWPERFGRVAAVSPGWMFRDERQGIGHDFHSAAIASIARASLSPREIRFVWGDGPSEWERRSRENGAAVMTALRARGAAVIDAGLVPGDHGIPLARAALAGAIDFLLRSGERAETATRSR